MATVKSAWTDRVIPNNGLIAAADWLGAGTLSLRGGTLSVKNDASAVYIALDLSLRAEDIGEGPLCNDFYWFVVDMSPAGSPNPPALWMMEGPNMLPAIPPTTSHRTWTIRVDLADLGITAGSPAVLRFGVRPVSATPAFTDDGPLNPVSDFADFDQVVLAMPPVRNMAGMINMWRLGPEYSLSI